MRIWWVMTSRIGAGGVMSRRALSNVDRAQKVKKITDKFQTKPLLEFGFDLGASKLSKVKLKNVKFESVKLGGGVGPRKKFPQKSSAKPATQPSARKSNGGGGNP